MLVMIELDNTLADRAAAVRAWIGQFCRERNLPVGADEWIHEQDQDGYAERRTVFESITSKFALSDAVDDLLDEYRSRVVALTTLTPGAMACVHELRDVGYCVTIESLADLPTAIAALSP